jgi:NADH dehydrogenase/NADH:ubiquinone oxidoreductase subunit G
MSTPKLLFVTLAIGITAVMLLGCTNEMERTTGSTTVDYEARNEFVRDAESKVRSLEVRLDELKRKTEAATGDAKMEAQTQVNAAEVRLQEAKTDLSALKNDIGNSSEEAWNRLKSEVDSAVEATEDAFDEVGDQLD